MSSVRVIAGSMKGRKIPFDTKKYNDADITPQKVKEALFSSLGDALRGALFVDLYGGSGQMSLEALSRGAAEVITGEPDSRRYRFIRNQAADLGLEDRWKVYHLRDVRLASLLQSEEKAADIIFCDPPYDKNKGPTKLYTKKLRLIEEAGILKENGTVVMQHFSFNELDESAGKFTVAKSHRYGNSAVTFYKIVTP